MNANERFEYMAEQFYKKTGMLAPGKDDPFERTNEYADLRVSKWNDFAENFYANLFQTHADMYKAIEELIGMFETEVFERYGEPGLSDDDVAEYKQILKRARGE